MNRLLLPRPFLDALVLRVLALWLFLHAASSAGAAVLEVPYPQSVVPTASGTIFLIAVILLVVRVEMGRKSEIIFLANLGHSFRGISLVAVLECLAFEVVLRVAVA